MLAGPQLLGVVVVVFFLTNVLPGDPIIALVGDNPAPPDFVAHLRADLGLDQPLYVQFARYLVRLAHGDLGYSFTYGAPVVRVIWDRVGATLLLTGLALALSTAGGIFFGALAAARHLRATDAALSLGALVAFSIPSFWLGQLLVMVFAVWLGWLPSLGMASLHAPPSGIAAALDLARHLVLPAVALAAGHLALTLRLTRSSTIEALQQDYIRTAHAKGASAATVLWRHAVPNALLSVLTSFGYSVGFLLSGSALVETVFGWPGIGRLLYDSLFRRDYPVMIGIFLVTSAAAIVANLAADMAYARVDPRVHLT